MEDKQMKLTKQQYFLIEFHCNYDYRRFIDALKTVCTSIKEFKSKIGELYFDVHGVYDPDCLLDDPDVFEVIHNHRHKGIRLIKRFDRKPSPQRYWTGDWEILI